MSSNAIRETQYALQHEVGKMDVVVLQCAAQHLLAAVSVEFYYKLNANIAGNTNG